MVTFTLSERPLHEERVDGYVVFCEQDNVINNVSVQALTRYYPALYDIIQRRSFKGAAATTLVVAGLDGTRSVYCILAGLGSSKKSKNDRLEQYRRAVGAAARAVEAARLSSVVLQLPERAWFSCDAYTLARETSLSFDMAMYHFVGFITEHETKNAHYAVTLAVRADDYAMVEKGVHDGRTIAAAVNQARTWCDMPPSLLTPTILAQEAEKIARTHTLKATIFNEADVIAMGMGGLAGVSAGSAQECRFVVLEYSCGDVNAPTIALVGKGITFDSGGLSLKPSAGMDAMKDDMAGAASVIATMSLLSHFKPSVNVIGVAPMSENLPSGTATKPGDILRFYNGKTAEVKDTDAEGRLILADALSYTVKKYKPTLIISIATLTGSCAAALGHFFCGLMSSYDEQAQRVLSSSYRSGDRAWPLPLNDDYKPAIKSDIADICNIGNARYKAGAITAGLFLTHFVEDVPYVHLDIAGTAFNVPDVSYYRSGATGFGVRLFIDLVTTWHDQQ